MIVMWHNLVNGIEWTESPLLHQNPSIFKTIEQKLEQKTKYHIILK